MTTKAVLLDLDGTLLDTARDMAGALNLLRRERSQPDIAFELIRPHVSHGAAALVRLGFAEADEEQMVELRARFLELYRDNLVAATAPFDGFTQVLETLERHDIGWGIVTNKPAFLTEPLLQALQPPLRPHCVVSGDTVAQRKPHPAPMLHAAKLLGVAASDCLYVGDAQRDVVAARAAGMRVVVAMFGYLAATDTPEQWGADGAIESPADLLKWVRFPGPPAQDKPPQRDTP